MQRVNLSNRTLISFFPPALAVEGIKSVPPVCLSVCPSVCPSVSALTPEFSQIRRSMGQEY